MPDPVSVKLGALVEDPPVVPKVIALFISAAALNPPVPVQEKLVAFAIPKLVSPAVVVARTILPDPNAILRVVVLLELKLPVVSVNPAKSNVPAVSVVCAVTPVAKAPASVVVPLGQLTVSAEIALPFGVIVPVPDVVTVKAVNVPVLERVKLLTVTAVLGIVKLVVPKSK